MRKKLQVLVVAIGLMSLTQVNAGIEAFCFTDAFGYVADVSATRTAPGYWELEGTADVLTGYDWAVSGYYDKASDTWSITFTNTAPDGCTFYVDYFTYTSTSYGGGTINFSWTSYCFGGPLSSGTGSTTYTQGHCPLKLGGDVDPIGPMSSDESISLKPVVQLQSIPGGTTFGDLFEVETLSVANYGENNFSINYQLVENTKVEINIYNHVGQLITTLVNDSKTEGYYSTNWDGAQANSGMYIVELKTDFGSI
ncbi:MAG: T9SS type A sorting domain-containing protein, partial [Chitinophagales bacterium]